MILVADGDQGAPNRVLNEVVLQELVEFDAFDVGLGLMCSQSNVLQVVR